jgi:hypothetical protein
MNDFENYDVLPLPVNIFRQLEDEAEVKPFVAVYFPAELLDRMKWTRKTPLNLIVDGETLIISKKDLEYELEPQPEPSYI